MPLRALLLATLAALAWPSQADAQIYAWRDANGNLVLSDRRLDPGAVPNAVTYTVPNVRALRSTPPVISSDVSGRFEPLVQAHAARHGLRADLVRAVIQIESGFNPGATSPKGAMGLMQLMPATSRELGIRNAYDPAENIAGGTAHLRQLLDRYGGDEELALAAYNAGSGAVDRHGRQVPPYQETKAFVRKVGSTAEVTRSSGPAPPTRIIYKTIEVINGRLVARYSTARPASSSYQIVGPWSTILD